MSNLPDAHTTHAAHKIVPVGLPAFFTLARHAIALLQHAHSRRPFHGCVNAGTLDLHRQQHSTHASPLSDAQPAQQHLAYISPEQSGRISRSVDYRSDYYSLGVVFYELLSGRLPFTSTNALELVHCHIAQQPAPLTDLQPDIPKPVGDIVLKLLSKNAEDRYQSLESLSSDLAYCCQSLQQAGTIAAFSLGKNDVADRFHLPHKLYGRDKESKRLLNAFSRAASGRTELFLVSGYSGVGKSSLVTSIQSAIVAAHGIYLSGKFDQSKQDIPYVTLAHAFQALVRQILSGSEREVVRWKEAIQEAAGINAQLLVDLIPELGYLIGQQPAVAEIAPNEAANRFLSVFRQFVGVFASSAHPLVLFLDDLQWMDAGSRTLLEHMLTHSTIKHLLVIGAYRENEVGPETPLMRSVDSIRASGGAVHHVLLQPLTQNEMDQLVADILRSDPAKIQPLAQLLHTKSAGNPFFAVQFLTALHEEGLLSFDPQADLWHWNIDQIAARSFTDNVVDLMLEKLQRLPLPTLDVLKHLALLGDSAHIAMLGKIRDISVDDTESTLQEALRASLVVRQADAIRFAHDRIQESVYSLIPEDERSAMHLHIGRVLLSQTEAHEIDGMVFDLVHHLNRGVQLITTADERQRLCQLNIMAGRKARASVAYAAARGYLEQAIFLLPDNAWETSYGPSVSLYLECAECESVLGHFNEAEALLDVIIDHARSIHDRARVARLRIRMYFVATRGREGLNFGLKTLALFNVHFPETDDLFLENLSATRDELLLRLGQQPIADLIDLPAATDRDACIVIGLISDMLTTAHSSRPMLVLPMLLKALNLSLQYGNIEESCVIYSNIGLQMVTAFGNIETGFECSQMALRLNERFQDIKLRGRLLYIHGYAFQATRQHLSSCAPILEKAFVACREVGNIGFAGASIDAYVWTTWESGKPLHEVLQIAEPYKDFTRQSNSFAANCSISMLEILIKTCQGAVPDNDKDELVAAITKAGWGYSIGHYHITQQVLHFTFERYDEALAMADLAAAMPSTLHALALMVTQHFYHALTLAAIYPRVDAATQQAFDLVLQEKLKKLKLWADSCPQNYYNRYALVAAEIARLAGDDSKAVMLYEQAILSARDNGFMQNEALANEVVARFYRERGLTTTADAHLRSARDCYVRWGAFAKVAQMDARYPLVAIEAEAAMTSTIAMTGNMQDLDAMAVVHASQAVSGEIVLGKLIKSLLKTVIESAGAERGLLILPDGGNHQIVAEAITQDGEVVIALRQDTVTAADLPLSVFQYVIRTCELILLDNAPTSDHCANDPYTQKTGVQSVMPFS